jgi:sugar phosphate isomerase/epimerase
MQVEFYCPRWGSEHVDWDLFLRNVKDAGYNGIEYAIGRTVEEKELDEVWNLVARHNLKIIPQHYDTYESNFVVHYTHFSEWIEKIKPYPCRKINSQTGKDFFSFEDNKKLIDLATNSGLNVVHETHRNKFSFSAHSTKEYLQRIHELRITLDASHWVCVAESYLDDQKDAMELAISRTDHIHARVGYPEGAQVPDPRIKEWEQALNKHLVWWDKVVEIKRKENIDLTITPEFGPFPYMVHSPKTNEPVFDQWEVNVWMMELLRKRYSNAIEKDNEQLQPHTY